MGYARLVTTAHPLHYDYADYLASLDASSLKLEYYRGVIYAMTGGTRAHAELAAATIVALASALPKTCRIATSDLKIRIDESDLSTFPDVSVVCGEPRSSSIDPNALTNPTLLVEVTSRSTEDYDRGEKLRHYQRIASLQAVLLVSHRAPVVTVVAREGAGFVEHDVALGEEISLPVLGASFPVNAIYDGIELDGA